MSDSREPEGSLEGPDHAAQAPSATLSPRDLPWVIPSEHGDGWTNPPPPPG